jgi:tetratricopeptide (TPR) repeat protein
MRVARVLFLGFLATGSATALAAQIPTRKPAIGPSTSLAPRMLVGNPHSYTIEDSAHSVAVGEALRNRMEKLVGGQFRVVTRAEMNEALKQFGYPADAILSPIPLRAFAQSLNAKVAIVSTLSHDATGKHVLTARLAGLNDDAGVVVVIPPGAGENHAEIGAKIAEGFAQALKVWADARACVDQSKPAPEKAIAAAKKAISVVPNHGLANYCLGLLALARGRKADSVEAMGYFKTAVGGDPLSLAAWTQLAAGYEAQGDTTNTVAALKQMLLIAPTNQPLRELAFKKFLSYGRPETAEQVADDGLKLDPSNVDLFELRANARAFRENYSGALDDLEQIVALDSTRADSSFYVKYLVFASQKPDTARLVEWSSKALRRFPDNLTLVKQVSGDYSMVGLGDSLMGALNVLVGMDTASAVGLALQEAKASLDAKQATEAGPFLDFASRYGDAQAKEGAAGLLLNGTLTLLQPPANYAAAADGLRKVVAVASPQGRYAPIANYYLGFSLVNMVIAADKEAEAQKSCDTAKRVESMTAEGETALTLAAPYLQTPQGAGQAKSYEQLKGYLVGLKPRTTSMIKVYCK